MGITAGYRTTHGRGWRWPVFIQLLFTAFCLLALSSSLIIWGGTGFVNLPSGAGSAQEVERKPLSEKVRTGIENMDGYMEVFNGKRVGLITNATGINSNFTPSPELLKARVNLVALFAPEHGLRGNAVAGAAIPHEKDAKTGLPIFSLHGDIRKPSAEMLKNIDVLAFDIQDVGARSYTYIYTMAYAMQSARENGKTFVVFDRPNPVGGERVEGGIMNSAYSSFIGLYPIPIRHGMTVGELARLFNEEFGIGVRLIVVPMTGWIRSMQQEDTGLPWIMTSPNIPTPDAARVYSGTGMFGGSNVSEGIGTTRPFELVGAPWLDSRKLAEKMNGFGLAAVVFRPVHFSPQWGKYQGKICNGIQIHVTDRRRYEPVTVGIRLLQAIREQGGAQFKWNPPYGNERWMIDLYAGGPELREGKIPPNELLERWNREAAEFRRRSAKYLLYP